MAARRESARGVGLGTMRSANRSVVLDVIRADGPIGRAAIAKAVSLAKPTVSLIVDELLARGVVREVGQSAEGPSRGRPPVLLEFDPSSQYVVGVHIGVIHTTVVLADGGGAEVARARRSTAAATPAGAFDAIAADVAGLLASAKVPPSSLTAVGACLPGLVDPATGTCLFAPNLVWHDVPVAPLLSARLGVPAFIHNTVQATAAAEYVEGAARNATTAAVLYAGTGVGAAVVQAGRILHGAHGLAGEIGHAVLPGVTERCSCGKQGCLETVASGPAIARAARAGIAAGHVTSLAATGGDLGAVDVASAARDGDPVAGGILAAAGEALGIAASWLVNLVNPDVLVIAGGLADAGPALIEPLRRAVMRDALAESARGLVVRRWSLGQEAKVRGAVLLALQASEEAVRVVFTT